MVRITELIDRRDGGKLVAAVDQQACVAREGDGVARYRDDKGRRALRDLARLGVGALARRIEHDGVEGFQFARHQGATEQVARLRLDRLQAAGGRRRALERFDRARIAVGGGDTRALGQPQRKRADAAKQVGNAFGCADMFDHQPRQRRFAFRRRLQESAGRQRHMSAADLQHRLGRLRHQLAVAGEAGKLVLAGDAGERGHGRG